MNFSYQVSADQPKFVVGTLDSRVSSEDDEDDDDDNDVVTAVSGKGKPVRQNSTEAFLPNVGIVMSNTNITLPEPTTFASPDNSDQLVPNITDVSLNQVVHHDVQIRKHPLIHARTDLEIDISKLDSFTACTTFTNKHINRHSPTPEIIVEKQEIGKFEPPKSLPVKKTDEATLSSEVLDKTKKISRSSGDVDANKHNTGTGGDLSVVDGNETKRSTSERDLTLGISASQSENALKSIRSTATAVLTSPSSVLSPFSKLAKGVQSLGANLDPRRLKTTTEKIVPKQHHHFPTEHQIAENMKLQELWKKHNCKSRLIAV